MLRAGVGQSTDVSTERAAEEAAKQAMAQAGISRADVAVAVLIEWDERVQRLVDNIRQSDAIRQSMEEARQAVSRALHALEDAPACPEREALENLAKFIVDRKV